MGLLNKKEFKNDLVNINFMKCCVVLLLKIKERGSLHEKGKIKKWEIKNNIFYVNIKNSWQNIKQCYNIGS